MKYTGGSLLKQYNIYGPVAFLLSPVATAAVNRAFQMADFIDYQREGYDGAPDICFGTYAPKS